MTSKKHDELMDIAQELLVNGATRYEASEALQARTGYPSDVCDPLVSETAVHPVTIAIIKAKS